MTIDSFEEAVIAYVLIPVAGLLALFVLICGFVYIPVGLVTEARCLEAGYPKAAVTWNLNRYCMNLEGTVTVSVQAIE